MEHFAFAVSVTEKKKRKMTALMAYSLVEARANGVDIWKTSKLLRWGWGVGGCGVCAVGGGDCHFSRIYNSLYIGIT